MVRPIKATMYDWTFSNSATTDWGYARTTTDCTDGGWRDISNTPVSEMGHMYYVNLGNLGLVTPNDDNPSSVSEQHGWGLSNTGPFSNVQSNPYWSGTQINSTEAGWFNFDTGAQNKNFKVAGMFAWAVRSGDVPAVVPVPAAVWLFCSGLLGLIGVARGKKAV
jgi:hypothetical protein